MSSVGVIRDKNLPLSDMAGHICYFRHALALDERRVKFLPEYVQNGASTEENGHSSGQPTNTDHGSSFPRVKEVWFAGTHSDM